LKEIFFFLRRFYAENHTQKVDLTATDILIKQNKKEEKLIWQGTAQHSSRHSFESCLQLKSSTAEMQAKLSEMFVS
jgi:hypothetical protein